MNREYVNTRLEPTQVITIYNDKHKSQYYLEHREVKEINGKSIVMAPAPMSEDVFRNIAQSYMKGKALNMIFDGLIPEHILYGNHKLGKTVVIWYRPAMKRLLNFSASLKIKSDSLVHIPATVYLSVNNDLYVFSMEKSDRPSYKTKLFKAPFFNIYEDGKVCLGTARIGKRTGSYEKEADRFEKAFYLAEQNGGMFLQQCKTDLKKLWPDVIQKKTVFPQKELVQHPKFKTLSDLINRFVGEINDYDDSEDY